MSLWLILLGLLLCLAKPLWKIAKIIGAGLSILFEIVLSDGNFIGLLLVLAMGVGFITLLCCVGSDDPNLQRMINQSWVSTEPDAQVRIKRLEGVAVYLKNSDHHSEARDCLINHTYATNEPDKQIREWADRVLAQDQSK